MNTRQRNFIVATALLVVVGTLAFALSRPGDGARTAKAERMSGSAPAASDRSRSAFHARAKTTRRNADQSGKLGVRPESGPMAVRIDPARSGDPDLAEKAARVEAYAKERLAALDGELRLTESQKRRIFPLLVRNSESYDPAMAAVSAGGGALAGGRPGGGRLSDQGVRAGIQDALDPAQRGDLIERDLSEMMLWEEIIENLVRRLDEAGPGQSATAPAAPASGDSESLPSSRGGRNLYDSESSR